MINDSASKRLILLHSHTVSLIFQTFIPCILYEKALSLTPLKQGIRLQKETPRNQTHLPKTRMHGISLGKDGSCLNDLLEAVWPFHEKPFYALKGKISIVF